MTLRKFIEVASQEIERLFDQLGEIRPMWHFVDGDGDHAVCNAPDPDKDISVAMMRAVFKVLHVQRYLFVNEAWSAQPNSNEEVAELQAWLAAHDDSIADYPKRREVVMFSAEDENEGQLTAERIIDRSGSKPKLGPLIVNDLTGWTSSGRMVGLLPRRGSLQ